MSLLAEIDEKKKDITTDGYPMSIGELVSLYKENAIDVHPEFQRFFRWKDLQKSMLIESILLGIPIPPIFVSQRKDGVWDVVDGQQRLSTLFEFMGVLRNSANSILPASTLIATDYLPSLASMRWDNPENPELEFSQDLKFIFKREKLDIKIVKRESDENMKYELFQRLNTLGSKLSDQEVRNCLLVMIKPEFYRWLLSLAELPEFISTTSLADRLLEEQYNIELVLRFLIFKRVDPNEIKRFSDLGEYITKKMIELSRDNSFNYQLEEDDFKLTFSIIDKCLGANSFKRYNPSKAKFEGSFLISGYESVAIAIGRNIDHWRDIEINENRIEDVVQKVQEIWQDQEYTASTRSGVNVSRRLPSIIPIGQRILVP